MPSLPQHDFVSSELHALTQQGSVDSRHLGTVWFLSHAPAFHLLPWTAVIPGVREYMDAVEGSWLCPSWPSVSPLSVSSTSPLDVTQNCKASGLGEGGA